METNLYPEFVYTLAAAVGEKKRIIVAPDAVAYSEGLACGDQLSIELSLIDSRCEFSVHVDGCLLCCASTAYMLDLLNEKPIQEMREFAVAFLANLGATCSKREILGPWQTYQVPRDRKECIASPWRLLLAAINSLSTTCSTDNKLALLACDACVQSHRVIWNQERAVQNKKQDGKRFIQALKVLRQMDVVTDLRWQPLGKCVLSPTELRQLQSELRQCTEKDIRAIKKLRLPALLYNNLLTITSMPQDHGVWLLVKKQRIRHYATQQELAQVEKMIRSQGWKIIPVKGAITSKLYENPAVRPHLDYDFVAASIKEAFALASWLMATRGFRFVTGGSVPFSLKVIVDNAGQEVLTGHFHLEKIIDDAYQVVIDINFPGFPLSRTSLFQLTFDNEELSWEEQLVITLCHIFKHELVFMKDINDVFLLLTTRNFNKQLLGKHLKRHNLNFYYQLLISFLEQAYNLPTTYRSGCSKADMLMIKWLLSKKWPYSRQTHFFAKAIDLVKRSRMRSGFLGALRELRHQSLWTSPRELKGALGRKLGVPLNTRLYLFPVAIFNRYIVLPDFRDGEESIVAGKAEIIVPGQLVVITVDEIQIVVTSMGMFLPTSELQTVGDKRAFTNLAKSVLAKLNLEREDLINGSTQAARTDLWLF